MEPVIETDVVVVGAGPTGLTAASLLAEHGLHVTVIERNPGTGDEPRAISVTDETLRVMQQIGILHELKPEMLMGTGSRYYGRRGQLLARVVPAGSRLGQPAKSTFDQPVLEALLLAAAEKRDNVDVRLRTEARFVRDFGTHVDVPTSGPDGPITFRAHWLVACDGGRSPVREQLGIAMEGSTQVEKWIVIDILNAGEHDKFSDFHCNGTRPGVVVPGVNGRCRFEFMLLPGETPDDVLDRSTIATLVAPYLPRPVDPADIRRATVYVAHQRVARQFRRGRVVLAGDAAHMMPPFAGQGLNSGIRDAANLAWKVAAVIKGTGSDALVSTYDTERKPHAAEMVKVSRRIGKVVMSTDARVTVLRDGVLAATGLVPQVKNWIASMRFLKPPHFHEGCVAKPDRGVPHRTAALVGTALSQPDVTLPSGAVAALDTLLGTGWSALRVTGVRTVEVIPLEPPGAGGGRERRVVQDAAGAFDLVGPGFTMVVRPDRYIAAVCRVGQEGQAVAPLTGLVPWLVGALDRR